MRPGEHILVEEPCVRILAAEAYKSLPLRAEEPGEHPLPIASPLLKAYDGLEAPAGPSELAEVHPK